MIPCDTVGHRKDQLPGFPARHVLDRPAPEQVAARLIQVDQGVLVTGSKQLLAGRNRLGIKQVEAGEARGNRQFTVGQDRRQQIERTCQGLTAGRLNPARLPQHDRGPQTTVVGRKF